MKQELSAAELPVAALGIAHGVSCKHKALPGPKWINKQCCGEGAAGSMASAPCWERKCLLLSYAGKQGERALGGQAVPRAVVPQGAVGCSMQSPGTARAQGVCHPSEEVRQGDCVGTVQGFVLQVSISWDHREIVALLHQGCSRTGAGRDAAWFQVAAAGLIVSALCCRAGTHAAQPGLCSGQCQGNLGLAGHRARGLRACPFCPGAMVGLWSPLLCLGHGGVGKEPAAPCLAMTFAFPVALRQS